MKRAFRLVSLLAFCAGAFWIFSASTVSFPKLLRWLGRSASAAPSLQTRENFDIRAGHLATLNDPQDAEIKYDPAQEVLRFSTRRSLQAYKLKSLRSSVQLKWSSLTTAPSRVFSFTENLTGPSSDDPVLIARRFLKDNDDLFRLGSEGVDGLNVSRRYRTEHNGLTHITLQQQINGIEVFGANMAIHLARDGSVLAANGELVPKIAQTANLTTAKLSVDEGLKIAAQDAGAELQFPLQHRTQAAGRELRQSYQRNIGFERDVESKLVYFPLSHESSRLAWQYTLWMLNTPDVYLTLVDAENGTILFRHNLTYYEENPLKPHGPVFTGDSPRPDSPHISDNPPTVDREDVPFRAGFFNGSALFSIADPHYDWWAGKPGDALISNNTDTRLDRVADNMPDLPRIAAPNGDFTFPLNLSLEPTVEENQKSAQVHLFYWVNRYHDILYNFGFNEAAANFQTDNFNLGGVGGDAIIADAQDGSGTNNANFSVGPDGSPGRVQMYLFTGTPNRDGDLDQHVLLHELTHGTSHRLIGNAQGLRGTQGGGMGEGWSDWFGLVLPRKEGDALDGVYPAGGYVTANYARGSRRFPYSTRLDVSPLTYKDIAINFSAPHPIGEIWCNTLWEMRSLLISRYGFKEGQRQSIQLVVDGMKLTPNTPSFVDARNAILLADRVNNKGANQCLLWQAFSKRGLGFRAETADSNDTAPTESLVSAPYCSDVGTIALNRFNYLPGENLNLSLGDRNASAPIQVQITTTKTGDSETVTLTPEPNVQGSFFGALKLGRGRAKPGDGVVQGSVDLGDQIVAEYTDNDDGNGAVKKTRAIARFAREGAIFEDSVEEGNRGWIANGPWAITNLRSASPTHSWTDSPAGRYNAGTTVALVSPLFDLTGVSDIQLDFSQSYEFAATNFDFGIVEVSTDDGSSWRSVGSVTGARAGFEQARIPLRKLDGESRARVRFRLQTLSIQGDGWYIDDIRLTGRSSDPAVIPPGNPESPSLAAISPAFGPPAGGSRVAISGANFTETANTTVLFDGIPAIQVSVVSANLILAMAPAHSAGAVAVTVNNINGAGVLIGGFTYYAPGGATTAPELKAIAPNTGVVLGGTLATLFGANFTPETTIEFGGRRATTTYVNPGVLRALTPPSPATGPVDVVARQASLSSTLPQGFSYIAPSPPVVSVTTPAAGESYFAGSVVNLRWTASDDGAVASHRIMLQRFLGPTAPTPYQLAAELASSLPGDARSFAWTIPALPTGEYRIRIIAADDQGTESDAYSQNFSIDRRWTPAAPLPTPVAGYGAVSDGRYLYQVSGLVLTTGLPTDAKVRKLDTTAASPAWVEVAPMPTGLNSIEAAYLKGKIYVPGGFDAQNQRVVSHFAYDTTGDAWTSVPDAPSAATFYSMAADDARGVYYRIGGTGANGPLRTVHSFNPAENKWTELPPMRVAHSNPAAEVIDGKLYVAGGVGATGALTAAEVYDFGAGQWTELAPMNRSRNSPVSFATSDPAGNRLWVVLGGVDATGAFPNTEVYDLRNNRWVLLDNSFGLNTPRQLLGGARAGDFFYAYGSNSSLTTTANERIRVSGITPVPFDLAAPVLSAPVNLIATPTHELRFTVGVNDLASGTRATLTAADLPDGANFETRTLTNNSVVGVFRWTPAAADAGKTFSVTFTASDGQLSDVKTIPIRVVQASLLTAVNAADFRTGPIAANSIASIFGQNLAVRPELAQTTPLPVELAGTTVTIDGVQAQLIFVSAFQINFVVPASIDPGPATIVVSNPTGVFAAGLVQIEASAPAIFTLNSTGSGDASALATQDGVTFQTPPFDILVNGKPNILILFATGIRGAQADDPNDENGVAEAVTVTIDGRAARTIFAGAQGSLAGVDQLNVELPASLAGGGPRRVEVSVSVNGAAANRAAIQIK